MSFKEDINLYQLNCISLCTQHATHFCIIKKKYSVLWNAFQQILIISLQSSLRHIPWSHIIITSDSFEFFSYQIITVQTCSNALLQHYFYFGLIFCLVFTESHLLLYPKRFPLYISCQTHEYHTYPNMRMISYFSIM